MRYDVCGGRLFCPGADMGWWFSTRSGEEKETRRLQRDDEKGGSGTRLNVGQGPLVGNDVLSGPPQSIPRESLCRPEKYEG
jgi:hypothetical protein